MQVAGLEPARCCHRGILSPLRLPIPPHLRNGWRWIRTTEAICSRFTVCPLWPLGNPSIQSREHIAHEVLTIIEYTISSVKTQDHNFKNYWLYCNVYCSSCIIYAFSYLNTIADVPGSVTITLPETMGYSCTSTSNPSAVVSITHCITPSLGAPIYHTSISLVIS